MNIKDIDFARNYLELELRVDEILNSELLSAELVSKLKNYWALLNLPMKKKANLRSEIQLLNSRLMLLFFDREFTKDLRAAIQKYSLLSDEKFKLLNKLQDGFIEHLADLLGETEISEALALKDRILNYWGIQFKFLNEKSFSLSSFRYSISDFNLADHNKQLFLLLKDTPGLRPEVIERIRFDKSDSHLLGIDLRFSKKQTLKLLSKKLDEIYSKQESQSEERSKHELNFFSPHKMSNILSAQPNHEHFNLHLQALKLKSEHPKLKSDALAALISSSMSEEGVTSENEDKDTKTLAKIMNDLHLITRAFHPVLWDKKEIVY